MELKTDRLTLMPTKTEDEAVSSTIVNLFYVALIYLSAIIAKCLASPLSHLRYQN